MVAKRRPSVPNLDALVENLLKKLSLMPLMDLLRNTKRSKKKEIMPTEHKKRLRMLIRNKSMPLLNRRKNKILRIQLSKSKMMKRN